MRKPGIPSAENKFDSAVKETLEIMLGRRSSKVAPLPENATLQDVVKKINELINLLQ